MYSCAFAASVNVAYAAAALALLVFHRRAASTVTDRRRIGVLIFTDRAGGNWFDTADLVLLTARADDGVQSVSLESTNDPRTRATRG